MLTSGDWARGPSEDDLIADLQKDTHSLRYQMIELEKKLENVRGWLIVGAIAIASYYLPAGLIQWP